jgi:chitin disaccharide deacetylase
LKNYLLCADDFLFTKNISLGIINLLSKDKINATSAMVIFSKNKSFGTLLKKKIKKKQIIGLHLVLTNYKPLHKFKYIKKFPGLLKLILNILIRKIKVNEIEIEIKSQIVEFKKIFGHLPTYIDGHHHVHQMPFISDILIDVINKIYPKQNKPLVRNTHLKLILILKNNIELLKTIMLSLFGLYLKNKLKKNNIPTNNYFFGIYDFLKMNDYKKNFLLFEKFKKNGSIFMTHPGFVDKEILKLDTLTNQRFEEYKALSGDFNFYDS